VTGFAITLAGLVGLVIGSFLNVVVWRVPRHLSVVHPPSACPRCGSRIAAYDNVPVLSWLVLRGRCRRCHEPIAARYPLVELGTGLAFAAVVWRFGLTWQVPAYLYLAAIGIALALIDIDVHRLPDAIVLPSYPVVAVLLTAAAWADGTWWPLGRAGIGALALGAFYGVTWLAYPKGMGRGDVKLAVIVGAALAWVGWGALVVGAFAAFLLGGIFSIALMAAGRAGRKSKVPFGPWMIVGAAVGVAVGETLWSAYLDLLG